MTQQEHVEQNIRLVLGDLTLQIVMLKARIAELEESRPEPSKPNGKHKEQEARP